MGHRFAQINTKLSCLYLCTSVPHPWLKLFLLVLRLPLNRVGAQLCWHFSGPLWGRLQIGLLLDHFTEVGIVLFLRFGRFFYLAHVVAQPGEQVRSYLGFGANAC